MSWAKPVPLTIAAALLTATASACSSSVGAPASSTSPSAPPGAAPSPAPTSAIAASSVPGILIPPSTPILLPAQVSLSAPSNEAVWALVDGTLLYRSTDRGTTWQQRPIPPANFPRAEISFIDGHQGWLTTGGVPETQCNGAGTAVWHTPDGGTTWQQVASVYSPQQLPGGIGYRQCKGGLSFVDALHGFLGASDPNSRPTIYRTADGGYTWAASVLPDPPGFVTYGAGDALYPGLARGVGTTLLIAAWGMQPGAQMESEYIFRSVDGGATWTYLAATGQGINNVTFVTESRWLKISNSASGLETTDAGKTWHSYPSGYQDGAGDPSVFVFSDSLVAYGISGGRIHRTVDGGLHWALIKTPGL